MCALAACVARTSGPCGQKVVMNVTGGGVSEIVGSLVGLPSEFHLICQGHVSRTSCFVGFFRSHGIKFISKVK